jgi:hypothetical protein
MPRRVDMIFARHPLDPRGGGSNSLRPPKLQEPSRYFGLPMMNSGKLPLPPNRPYRRSFNYPEYVKDFDPDVYVKVF